MHSLHRAFCGDRSILFRGRRAAAAESTAQKNAHDDAQWFCSPMGNPKKPMGRQSSWETSGSWELGTWRF
eukprot:COSAG06_NODE_37508_length_434_cov_1.208955_1_plen_69_part_01